MTGQVLHKNSPLKVTQGRFYITNLPKIESEDVTTLSLNGVKEGDVLIDLQAWNIYGYRVSLNLVRRGNTPILLSDENFRLSTMNEYGKAIVLKPYTSTTLYIPIWPDGGNATLGRLHISMMEDHTFVHWNY